MARQLLQHARCSVSLAFTALTVNPSDVFSFKHARVRVCGVYQHRHHIHVPRSLGSSCFPFNRNQRHISPFLKFLSYTMRSKRC
jgi:hypothetical protein